MVVRRSLKLLEGGGTERGRSPSGVPHLFEQSSADCGDLHLLANLRKMMQRTKDAFSERVSALAWPKGKNRPPRPAFSFARSGAGFYKSRAD